MMKKKEQGFETLQVHAGQVVDPMTGSRAVPIYQTTSYVYESAEYAADLFALKTPGNIYTRLGNPTVEVLEQRIAALEGGVGALATASGMAAILYAIENLAQPGDEIACANTLYGGTHTLFSERLKPQYGMQANFFDPDDLDSLRVAITEKTKAVYIEALGNPNINIPDFEAIVKIAHENGIPVICDNTFATPYLLRVKDWGIDISVASLTKYMGGHGTSMGGVIVDNGIFDWNNEKFPTFTQPDEAYHGMVYAKDCGQAAYITKARVQSMRDTGACMSPFNAFLILQGIETLSLRMERHCQNGQAVAEYLDKHPAVSWVHYPSLPDNRYYELGKKYFPKGFGGILTFGIKGGVEAGRKLMNQVKLFSLLANVADAKSLIIHPASTTHSQLSEEALEVGGVSPDMVRLSIGLESIEDIIGDLEQAIEISQRG